MKNLDEKTKTKLLKIIKEKNIKNNYVNMLMMKI